MAVNESLAEEGSGTSFYLFPWGNRDMSSCRGLGWPAQ